MPFYSQQIRGIALCKRLIVHMFEQVFITTVLTQVYTGITTAGGSCRLFGRDLYQILNSSWTQTKMVVLQCNHSGASWYLPPTRDHVSLKLSFGGVFRVKVYRHTLRLTQVFLFRHPSSQKQSFLLNLSDRVANWIRNCLLPCYEMLNHWNNFENMVTSCSVKFIKLYLSRQWSIWFDSQSQLTTVDSTVGLFGHDLYEILNRLWTQTKIVVCVITHIPISPHHRLLTSFHQNEWSFRVNSFSSK